MTKLHSAQQACREDESTAADECLQLAEEVESITEGVIDVVADALDLYNNCHADKVNLYLLLLLKFTCYLSCMYIDLWYKVLGSK